MAKGVGRRYRACYAMLLRLYPQRFREQLGEAMAQTFHDLCREHHRAGRRLHGLALRTFLETAIAIAQENTSHMSQLGKTVFRVALAALALLMVPLVASRVVEGWNWPPRAFGFAYFLFFVTGMLYAFVARKMGVWSYKAAVGVALAAGFALGWSNMVHVSGTDNPANLIYYVVLAVGAIGAAVARLEARGLARTLFAMAAVMALISLLLPSGAPPDMARRMAIGHVGLVGLFTASGVLFRHASVEALP